MKCSHPLLFALCISALSLAWPAAAKQAHKLAPPEQTETITLRAGELPAVSLTPDILYRVLLAEIGAARGYYDLASSTLLGLARDTSDPRFAKRAFQYSMADRNVARALSAAREWALLSPKDPEAVASSLALAASSGETEGLAKALWQRIEKASNKEQAVAQAAAIVGKMQDRELALEVLEQALHDPVMALPVSHLALSDAAWGASDPYRAVEEANKALELDPNLEAAAQRLLEYGMKVDPDTAVAQAQAYVAGHPDAEKLQLMLVNRLVERRRYEDALFQVRQMRARNPENFDLLYTEAEVNIRAERYKEARALLNQYISVQTQRRQSINDESTNAAADASDARLLLVQIAEKEDNLKEAIAQLDRIDDPALAFQAQVHKAVLQGRMGDLKRAESTIGRLDPKDKHERAVVALTLASIYRESGRTDKAVEILQKADREMPDSTEIKYDLAMLYERQGNTDQFEKLMKRVIELDPDNANAYNSLGYTYADQNRNLDQAQDLLERALDLDPDNPYILDSVGWYLYRTGDYQAAIEYLQRSYDNLPTAEVGAHLGEVLWMDGLRDQAITVWRKAYDMDASNEILNETLKRLGVTLK
ncbi:tetratricopeptide repeat protein [Allopusillimonas soli]|uniref:Tetratricopeptide repeat protein n=1 Tax=Allopusillimonas soli TaxID=659016 RepID=A0A853F6W9_9BURK|nr:tetratricopeptide repeat protein [Allopusillimonas soli]NYT35717.1 tetratricopeptide repeat protein [Allopusillimonas soli]TEA76106.1 tetratricopeptide repeat protein [Allopusillimonas soli]